MWTRLFPYRQKRTKYTRRYTNTRNRVHKKDKTEKNNQSVSSLTCSTSRPSRITNTFIRNVLPLCVSSFFFLPASVVGKESGVVGVLLMLVKIKVGNGIASCGLVNAMNQCYILPERDYASVDWSWAAGQKDHRQRTGTCNGHCRSLEIDVHLM